MPLTAVPLLSMTCIGVVSAKHSPAKFVIFKLDIANFGVPEFLR